MKKIIIIADMEKVVIHKKRHIAKAVTWRIVGTLDTWLISWFLITYIGEVEFFNIELNEKITNKSAQTASYIAILELITKTILYYFHERVWYSLLWGSIRQRARHIIKTISWRFCGAIDTICLVFIVFYFMFDTVEGAAEVALSMFSIEIITKMLLYYIHERVWFISNYGVVKPTQ